MEQKSSISKFSREREKGRGVMGEGGRRHAKGVPVG